MMETSALNKAIRSLSLDDAPLVVQNNYEKSALSNLNPKSQKRERWIEEDDEQPKKNIRIDTPITTTTQWISVYSSRPTRQRYHCNVITLRLYHHIEKSKKDGLFISCIASQANRWAFIMDGGTGFTSQVYKLSPLFMHKEWIVEQWGKNYFITSIAGTNTGSTLVVMSKGTPYTLQYYKVSDSFPIEWINSKWNEGFHVTSMTTVRSCRWFVVMSKNSGYSKQAVERNFFYPSEAIHRRLESGYRITSMAAKTNQSAFILSIPKKNITDEVETQETRFSSDFPRTHVKEQWKKNRFVSLISYGRTMSGCSNGVLKQKYDRFGHSDDQDSRPTYPIWGNRGDDVHNALAALHISDENRRQSEKNKVMVAQPITHIDSVALPSNPGTCEAQADKTTSKIEKST